MFRQVGFSCEPRGSRRFGTGQFGIAPPIGNGRRERKPVDETRRKKLGPGIERVCLACPGAVGHGSSWCEGDEGRAMSAGVERRLRCGWNSVSKVCMSGGKALFSTASNLARQRDLTETRRLGQPRRELAGSSDAVGRHCYPAAAGCHGASGSCEAKTTRTLTVPPHWVPRRAATREAHGRS